MKGVFLIEGNVKFKLTIDPTIWIFDDRKIELDQHFKNDHLKDHLGIVFKPFLENAEPNEDAVSIKIEKHSNEPTVLPIEKVLNSVLCFAKNGKALTEDGPVYLYFGDGSNLNDPITDIKKLIVI